MANRDPYLAFTHADKKQMQIDYLTGKRTDAPFPPEISPPGGGGKFSPDGAPLFFPGNNFICHVDPASHTHAALRRLSKTLQKGPASQYFTYLPASSFHMTVFPAICGNPLGHDGWPAGISPGTTLNEINAIFDVRLSGKQEFQACRVKPVGTIAGTSIIVKGAAAGDEKALRQARDTFQEVTGLVRADFASYEFHISICYRTRWMSRELAIQHLAFIRSPFEAFKETISSFALGPVEFCQFENMHSFVPRSTIC